MAKQKVTLLEFEKMQEKLKEIEAKNKKIEEENEALNEELVKGNEDETEENDDENDDKRMPIGVLEDDNQDIAADMDLKEQFKEMLKKRTGSDTMEGATLSIVGSVSDKPTMENPELLGTIFSDLNFDEASDIDTLQNKIGSQFGPGYYSVHVKYKGQIWKRYTWCLSARKYKVPVVPVAGVQAGPNGDFSTLITAMMENNKIQAAGLEHKLDKAQERSDTLMMKMIEAGNNKPDMMTMLTPLLAITEKLNKNNNQPDVLGVAMKFMDQTIKMSERAQELNSNKSFMDYGKEVLMDVAGPLLKNMAQGSKEQAAAPGEVKATYTAPGQVTDGPVATTKNPAELETEKQQKLMLIKTGAMIYIINDMFYSYSADPDSPDDPDTYIERICTMGLNDSFKASINDIKDNEVLIARILMLGPDIAAMFKDDKFKNYAILVFDGVRKASAEIPVAVIEEPAKEV